MERYRVDLGHVMDREDFYDTLESTLPMPGYFGRNLDAFYDVLMEFGESWEIDFVNCSSMEEEAPGLLRKVKRLCRDAMLEDPALSIRFFSGDWDEAEGEEYPEEPDILD